MEKKVVKPSGSPKAKGAKLFEEVSSRKAIKPGTREEIVTNPSTSELARRKVFAKRIGTDEFGDRVYTQLSPLVVDLFLEGVSRSNSITKVCAELNLSRVVVYAMKAQDSVFKQRLFDAQTIGVDAWEDEAARRAFDGVERKVFHQGVQIDTIKEYSDSLAIAMLRGAKPERYALQTRNETVVGGSLGINLETLSDAELNEKIDAKLSLLGAITKADAISN